MNVNQQDATIFVSWFLYWSIWICSTRFGWQIHPPSGAVFDYTYMCVYIYIYIYIYMQVLVQCTDIAALYRSCIYSQKFSWRWASLSSETCRADSNRSIKRSINGICCIWLVAYIIVLMKHGLANVKRKIDECLRVVNDFVISLSISIDIYRYNFSVRVGRNYCLSELQ